MLAFVGLILVMGLREAPEAGRRPVALAVVDGGARVLVAGSGRVAVVDVERAEVAASWLVGEGVVDLTTARDGALVLAVDGPARSLVSFTRDGTTAQRVGRLPFASEPVAVATSADGTRAGVALRWERKVAVVELGPDAVPRMIRAVDLPFRPGRLARLRGDVIVATDATSTSLATIDLRAPRVLARVAWPGHNIGGLAASSDGQTLVVSHQTLGPLATTSFDDIHWGSTISNRLRVFRGDGLITGAPESALLEASRVVDLDDVGRASGDPGGVALSPRGETIVALSGVARLVVGPGAGPAPPFPARRLELDRGSRPTAVALSPDGTRGFVALTLDDALAVVDLTTDAAPRVIPLAPKRALDAVARGERLFFDARLSHDGWMSCHSCHTEGHTSGQLADTLGDRSYGAPKLTPSLLGVGATGPWNWTGSVDRLEDQVRASVETTMRGDKPSDAQVEDLTAYLRSLEPPKPLRLPEGELVAAGLEVFRRERCVECHAAPSFTREGLFDVGLVDERGTRKFNPPSLRGVGRRDALLHDGRARSLEELFGVIKHPAGRDLVPEERDALVEYLRTL